MSKLNKIIAGMTLAAALLAGGQSIADKPVKESATEQPVTTLKVISDPGGGGGH